MPIHTVVLSFFEESPSPISDYVVCEWPLSLYLQIINAKDYCLTYHCENGENWAIKAKSCICEGDYLLKRLNKILDNQVKGNLPKKENQLTKCCKESHKSDSSIICCTVAEYRRCRKFIFYLIQNLRSYLSKIVTFNFHFL